MKIQRIALDGFKNLSNVNIAFSKITSLVALNNFGKSNVLSGIDFGIDFMKCNEEQRQNLMRSDNAMPINRASQDKDFQYEIEMTTIIGTVKYRIIYGFTFGWLRTKEDEASINNEYLKVKIDEKGKKYISALPDYTILFYNKYFLEGWRIKNIILKYHLKSSVESFSFLLCSSV